MNNKEKVMWDLYYKPLYQIFLDKKGEFGKAVRKGDKSAAYKLEIEISDIVSVAKEEPTYLSMCLEMSKMAGTTVNWGSKARKGKTKKEKEDE